MIRIFSTCLIALLPASALLAGQQMNCGPNQGDAYAPRLFFNAKLEHREKVLHGAGQDHESFIAYREALGPERSPVLYMEYIDLGYEPDKILDWGTKVKSRLAGKENSGLIPQIGLSMVSGIDTGKGIDGLVSEGKMDAHILAFCQMLKDLNRPVFVRIGYEFEGAWNGYSPETYKRSFIRIARALKEHQVEAVTVWCAAGGSQPDVGMKEVMEYYPGDNWVDWWAIDVFSPEDITLPKTMEFLDGARDHHKPVMIGEATPRYVGVMDGKLSWERWFAPFFELIRSRPEIKAFCYINWDWEYFANLYGTSWGDWGDARIQKNAFILNQYQEEMNLPLYKHAETINP
jgi:hypothetical protein